MAQTSTHGTLGKKGYIFQSGPNFLPLIISLCLSHAHSLSSDSSNSAKMHESTTEATTLDMAKAPDYDVALWQVHETEDDCDIIIRTNNGRAFYCHISPSCFHRSPRVTEQYFNCIDLLRCGEEEKDDFYVEDACDWLSKPFQPLIAQLAPGTATSRRPTLSQYLFPPHFVCILEATDEKLHPLRLNTQEHGWSKSMISVNDDYLRDLDQWTRSYHPNDIELCYNRA